MFSVISRLNVPMFMWLLPTPTRLKWKVPSLFLIPCQNISWNTVKEELSFVLKGKTKPRKQLNYNHFSYAKFSFSFFIFFEILFSLILFLGILSNVCLSVVNEGFFGLVMIWNSNYWRFQISCFWKEVHKTAS